MSTGPAAARLPGADPLLALAGLPGVPEQVAAARAACEELRWHPAMRRRSAECRAEAAVWAARSSAALEGARLPVAVVRDGVRGAVALPSESAAGAGVAGADAPSPPTVLSGE